MHPAYAAPDREDGVLQIRVVAADDADTVACELTDLAGTANVVEEARTSSPSWCATPP